MKFKVIKIEIEQENIANLVLQTDVENIENISKHLGVQEETLVEQEINFELEISNSEKKLHAIMQRRGWYKSLGINKQRAYEYKVALLSGTMKKTTIEKLLSDLKEH